MNEIIFQLKKYINNEIFCFWFRVQQVHMEAQETQEHPGQRYSVFCFLIFFLVVNNKELVGMVFQWRPHSEGKSGEHNSGINFISQQQLFFLWEIYFLFSQPVLLRLCWTPSRDIIEPLRWEFEQENTGETWKSFLAGVMKLPHVWSLFSRSSPLGMGSTSLRSLDLTLTLRVEEKTDISNFWLKKTQNSDVCSSGNQMEMINWWDEDVGLCGQMVVGTVGQTDCRKEV